MAEYEVVLKLNFDELWHFWQILLAAYNDDTGTVHKDLVEKIETQTYKSTGRHEFKRSFKKINGIKRQND